MGRHQSSISFKLFSCVSILLALCTYTHVTNLVTCEVIDNHVSSHFGLFRRHRRSLQEENNEIMMTDTPVTSAPSKPLLSIDEESEYDKNNNNNNNNDDTDESIHLFPLTTSDYLGFVCAILGLMISAGAGIGGGGILVPIYILVMGFSTKRAIPLSNVTVVGGAIANNWLNRDKRHPLADRPLIDWDLIVSMVPPTLLGALVGAFVNKLLPDVVLTILLVILLAYTAWTTLEKALKMYRKESLAMAASANEVTPLATDSTNVKVSNTTTTHYESIVTEQYRTTLDGILKEEQRTPIRNVILLSVTFAVVLGVNILKGGGAFSSPLGITCGSLSFWLTNVFLFVSILTVYLYFRHYLVQRTALKQTCGYEYKKGDIQWDGKNTVKYGFVCFIAGLFAGMFGIGGGLITSPLILAMGVHPEVNLASTACMILFTALTATTSFIVFGLLIPDYGFVCFIFGFIATYIGHENLYYWMKRLKRNSLIAFSLGLVVLISAILMTLESGIAIATGKTGHSRGICELAEA